MSGIINFLATLLKIFELVVLFRFLNPRKKNRRKPKFNLSDFSDGRRLISREESKKKKKKKKPVHN